MEEESIIRQAEFNQSVKTYWVLTSCIPFVASLFGIPLLVIWIPIALVIADKYVRSLELTLTEKSVKLKKGVIVKVEKTIPLDKITNLGLSQGPIMRGLGIQGLTVETAGSTTPGALVSLPGVVDAREFRDAVLHQKELQMAGAGAETGGGLAASGGPSPVPGEHLEVLRDIRDSLRRIETQLASSDG